MNRSPVAHETSPTVADWKCAAETQCAIGEGPVWSAAERVLYFVDISAGRIYRYAPGDGGLRSFTAPELVTAIVPRVGGGLLASLKRSVAFVDPTTGKFGELHRVAREPDGNRFNDAKCDRRGRFFAGTMGDEQWSAPIGTLYRYGADLEPTVMVEHVRCSNGLGWSPDNRTFYYVESFAHTIWAFDYDIATGSLDRRRVFATLNPKSGAFPDGLTVDAEGGVWNAQPVFGRLVRYAPSGDIERIIEAPVSRPTSIAFGGDDLATLYVTSARDSLSPAELLEEPQAGGLFALRPGVRGLPETPFDG